MRANPPSSLLSMLASISGLVICLACSGPNSNANNNNNNTANNSNNTANGNNTGNANIVTTGDGTADNCTRSNAVVKATVDLKDFEFKPPCVQVAKGTKVTFTNSDVGPHQVVSNSDVDAFNLGNQDVGQETSHVFSTVGSVPIGCGYHPSMALTVLVY